MPLQISNLKVSANAAARYVDFKVVNYAAMLRTLGCTGRGERPTLNFVVHALVPKDSPTHILLTAPFGPTNVPKREFDNALSRDSALRDTTNAFVRIEFSELVDTTATKILGQFRTCRQFGLIPGVQLWGKGDDCFGRVRFTSFKRKPMVLRNRLTQPNPAVDASRAATLREPVALIKAVLERISNRSAVAYLDLMIVSYTAEGAGPGHRKAFATVQYPLVAENVSNDSLCAILREIDPRLVYFPEGLRLPLARPEVMKGMQANRRIGCSTKLRLMRDQFPEDILVLMGPPV